MLKDMMLEELEVTYIVADQGASEKTKPKFQKNYSIRNKYNGQTYVVLKVEEYMYTIKGTKYPYMKWLLPIDDQDEWECTRNGRKNNSNKYHHKVKKHENQRKNQR